MRWLRRVVWAGAAAAWLVAATAAAEPYAVGSLLPSMRIPDQHGQLRAVDESIRVILFNRDMDGGDFIKQALEEGGAERLVASRAVYVADISGMPGLVRRLIALPRMRKRPYPMLLDVEGNVTADFPGEEGRATAIFLDRLRVARIDHLEGADAVKAALDSAVRSESPSTE